MWLPLASPFELTGEILAAFELASVLHHRLVWALAGTVPAVLIIQTSKLTEVKLMSLTVLFFRCSGLWF